MKLYLHYELAGDEKTTTKLTVPKSWYGKPVVAVVQLFCEQYNKKHPDAPLDENEVHLNDSEGNGIFSDRSIGDSLFEVSPSSFMHDDCVTHTLAWRLLYQTRQFAIEEGQ